MRYHFFRRPSSNRSKTVHISFRVRPDLVQRLFRYETIDRAKKLKRLPIFIACIRRDRPEITSFKDRSNTVQTVLNKHSEPVQSLLKKRFRDPIVRRPFKHRSIIAQRLPRAWSQIFERSDPLDMSKDRSKIIRRSLQTSSRDQIV